MELHDALCHMKKGKSPCWDGIPAEFYLHFWTELGPLLLDMINYSVGKGKFHQNVNMAIISLLLKKDKDPTSCSNYRPVSLINTDIKVFAKVLARNLEVITPAIIHCDQTSL